jgi:hypothetical protein
LEPELGARVRYRGRSETVTHAWLQTDVKHAGNLLRPSRRRSVVVFLDPGSDGRGQEVTLFESDWHELEPIEESDD